MSPPITVTPDGSKVKMTSSGTTALPTSPTSAELKKTSSLTSSLSSNILSSLTGVGMGASTSNPQNPTDVNGLPGGGIKPSDPDLVSAEEMLLSLPTPVLRLLLILATPINSFRLLLEVLLWRSESPVKSWMVIGGWWAICLLGTGVWRYFLPPLLLIPFMPRPSSPSLRPPSVNLRPPLINSHSTSASAPASTQTLLKSISDLYAINGMLPTDLLAPGRELGAWFEGWRDMERKRLLRGMIVIWATWILINLFLGARVTLAITGTSVLLCPSPILRSTYQLLRKSLFLRRMATLLFLLAFGSPPSEQESGETHVFSGEDSIPIKLQRPSFSVKTWIRNKWSTSRRPSFAFRLRPYEGVVSSSLSGSAVEDDHPGEGSGELERLKPSPPIYFRFELHENQRWWMGLDWTSALLPQERPSWCDMYLNPASPPSSFTLPSETVIYLPEPRKGDSNGRVKRTAKWRWIDEDWNVVRKTGDSKTSQDPQGSSEIGLHKRSQSVSSSTTGNGDDSATPHPPADPSKTSTTKGLAEQAFVKGLERLKARTNIGTSANRDAAPSSPNNVRRQSSDFEADAMSESGESRGRERTLSDSSTRRRSSQMGDLSALLGSGGFGISGSSGSGHANALTTADLMLHQNTTAILHDLDVGTDADGWSYGDNKWENMGPKGGMGRYTRRRRWQRRAVCIETIEYIPGIIDAAAPTASKDQAEAEGTPRAERSLRLSAGVIDAVPPASGLKSEAQVEGYAVTAASSVGPAASAKPTPKMSPVPAPSAVIPDTPASSAPRGRTSSTAGGDRDQALRQRLRNAMGNIGG